MTTRTLTLSDQSLTQVCGDFFVKIVLSDSPLTESAASPYNRLGSAQSGITGPLNPCGGGSGSSPISYTFANSYHHRDHLGSLRAETDEAGNRSVKRDYYAFGIEMPNGFESSAPAATRRLFTEAERGVYNGLDYMMARFCSGNAGRFLSPDVVVGNVGNPQSWNRYSFVMNSPMNYTDPSGKLAMSPDQVGTPGPHPGGMLTHTRQVVGALPLSDTAYVAGSTFTATLTKSEIEAYEQSAAEGTTGIGTIDQTSFADSSGSPSGTKLNAAISPQDQQANAASLSNVNAAAIKRTVEFAGEFGFEDEVLVIAAATDVMTPLLVVTVYSLTEVHGDSSSVDALKAVTDLKTAGFHVLSFTHFHPGGITRPSGSGSKVSLKGDEKTYYRLRNEILRYEFDAFIVSKTEVGKFTHTWYIQHWTRLEYLK